MTTENKKKVFLIISGNPERAGMLSLFLQRHYEKPTIYEAPTGNVGLLKLKNAPIDIVIVDAENYTPDSLQAVKVILLQNLNPLMAIIIVGHPPEKEHFVDELVTGKLYFIEEQLNEQEFSQTLARALNFTSHTEPSSFRLRYLATGDILIKEGEKANYVYILKSGKLRAYNNIGAQKVILGNIEVGEFVGEMAYINNEPRSACIEALSDAQLIEVPIALVDKVLYKRPAWSKALMQTLSKRLKIANKTTENI